jgi:hypothetical protein
MVLEAADAQATEQVLSPAEQLAVALDELERNDEMPLTPVTPGTDGVSLIREGRAGAMWGSEP